MQEIRQTALDNGRRQLSPQEIAEVKQLSEAVQEHRTLVERFKRENSTRDTQESAIATSNEQNAQVFIDRYAQIARERPLTDAEKQAYRGAMQHMHDRVAN